jgi:hypothetical protein
MRRSSNSAKFSITLLSILLTIACSSGGGDSPAPTPTAHTPSISNLLYSPNSAIEDSGNVTVTATMQFSDSGADVQSFTLKIYNSSGNLLSTQSNTLNNTSGLSSGSITILGNFSTADNGNYTFSLSITDAAGNRSSELAGSFSINTAPPYYAQTLLLRGNWHFVYTIISVWTDDYSLTTMTDTTNSQGGYLITGTDQYGQYVNATYWPTDGRWTLLDQGTTIDKFYSFYTDGVNVLAGSCYYQIEVSTGNWSSCYNLSGSKTTLLSGLAVGKQNISVKMQRDLEASENTIFAPPEDEILVEKYLDHKNIQALRRDGL